MFFLRSGVCCSFGIYYVKVIFFLQAFFFFYICFVTGPMLMLFFSLLGSSRLSDKAFMIKLVCLDFKFDLCFSKTSDLFSQNMCFGALRIWVLLMSRLFKKKKKKQTKSERSFLSSIMLQTILLIWIFNENYSTWIIVGNCLIWDCLSWLIFFFFFCSFIFSLLFVWFFLNSVFSCISDTLNLRW